MPPDSSSTTASTCIPPPTMSPATKEMIARVRQMIPPMLERFHKGSFRLWWHFLWWGTWE
jgi:ATP-dependent NAD(P)H-hydrate dehydratase